MDIKLPHLKGKDKAIVAGTVVFFIAINYWAYYTKGLYVELKNTKEEFALSTSTLETAIKKLETEITDGKARYDNLSGLLNSEQRKRLELEQVKATNEKKIDTLTKLTTLDPELLKKYSKVYFLSENYTPPQLQDIKTDFLSDPAKNIQVLPQVSNYLTRMIEDVAREGLPLRVLSGYRSFAYQKSLKSEYKIIYGAGTANQFSAEQGYSEHQLGTTVDLTAPAIKSPDVTFENTAVFTWLNNNAYKYGFIISYPKVNKYYQYEPWHWRFVGVELATKLHNDGKYFYEIDQREIDQYLIKIFD